MVKVGGGELLRGRGALCYNPPRFGSGFGDAGTGSGMPSSQVDDKKTFSYEEAAGMLPEVRRLTEQAYLAVAALNASGGAAEAAQRRIDELVGEWARSLLDKGVEVKGLWLVDFDNGSGYYCWRYPEESLQFFHSYEDGFRGRMRIQ